MKVFIIAAISADGLMGASDTQSSLEWRSKEDGKSFGLLTRRAKVLVMGAATYRTFRMKRAPPERRLIIYTNHPETIKGEGIETTDDPPHALHDRLTREGYTELAVCGGATINSLFLEAGLVNELYLTVEPVVFGGGVPLLRTSKLTKLTLLDSTYLNPNSLLLHYAVTQ